MLYLNTLDTYASDSHILSIYSAITCHQFYIYNIKVQTNTSGFNVTIAVLHIQGGKDSNPGWVTWERVMVEGGGGNPSWQVPEP